MEDKQQPDLPRGNLDLEAGRILRGLAEDGVLFRVGWEGLLRHLLADYHSGSIFKATPEQLRSAAARSLDLQPSELPLEAAKLASEVFTEWLRIDKLPRDEFVSLQQDAAEDLRQIRANISECELELSELQDRKANDAEEDGDGHRAAYLQHKIAQNVDARNELLQFMEEGVTDEVLFRASERAYRKLLPMSFFWFRFPYHFRYAPHAYSPSSLSEVRNKFRDEPVSVVREWERLFDDDRAKFHVEAARHIDERKVVDAVRARLRNHHRLVLRAEVLEQALDAYEGGMYALFCNVIPVQIEGLVGDWARELGVSEKELRKAALTLKVDQIRKTETVFGDFEYFRYWFPVLRNRVAHGQFEAANVSQVANLLLLDLADLCSRLHDELLPTNKLVALLRGLDATSPNYEKAFEYVGLRHVAPPDFYSLDAKRAEADTILSSDGFWTWMDEHVASREPEFVSEAREAVISLKKSGLDGGRAPALLKKMAEAGL